MPTLRTEPVSASVKRGRSTNRRMLKTLVEQIDDGYYEVDLFGNFTYVNDYFASILGFPREEITAPGRRHFTRFTDADTVAQLTRTFSDILEYGKAERLVEAKFTRPDGTIGFVELSVAKLIDDTGEPVGYCGIVRDITNRRALEEMLDRRVKLLAILQQVDIELNHTLDIERVLTTAMSAAMIISNADSGGIGLLEGENIRLARVAGKYTPNLSFIPSGIMRRVLNNRRAELVTDVTHDPDYVPVIPETQAQLTCPMMTYDKLIGVVVLETDDAKRFTTEVFEFVQLLTARIAVSIDNAQLYGIAQKQLNELRTLNTQLRELEQLKSDMIRIASHDLRSPLGIIGGYLSIIREDLEAQLTPAHEQYIEAMMQGLDRIDRLTTDFLSLERLQSAKQPPRESVDIGLLVKKAVYDARAASRQKGIEFDADLPSGPLIITGEETDLYEAIVNLINNAMKYTPSGGRVAVQLVVSGNRACFTVEDTGIGIPEEFHPRLFQSFFRVKTIETRDIPGTGLGLHLVKKIIERHRGELIFRSVHGQGSVFGFTLPLQMIPLEREGHGSRSTQVD